MLKLTMAISSSLRALVLQRDQFKCQFCGATKEQSLLQVDHIFPRSDGGTDTLDNLATLCQRCNRGKSNMYFGNYMQLIKDGNLPRPQYRSALYPPEIYQEQALKQLVDNLRLNGHEELTLQEFSQVIKTVGLRDGINPMYEPLTFATSKEGFNKLIEENIISLAGEFIKINNI